MPIYLPNNWRPRPYQWPAWDYLQNGGRHAELIWHRRSGKDDVSLHHTACAAHERRGNYWHMLPKANQARKAIWHAVNPRTGIKRVDEAFPLELRKKTLDQEMFIELKCGSTWQVLGSDNFQAFIGSPPIGCVYSEWAQANPAVRGYLRPIFTENGGWQIYITTPRGKNHAHKTFMSGKHMPGVFSQLLTIDDTGSLNKEQLELELREYTDTYGYDQGVALFQQEYYCSFEAAILGAYYGGELTECRNSGRITDVAHDPEYPVFVSMDIGRTDDTSVWWYQVIGNQLCVLESESFSLKDPDYTCGRLRGMEVDINFVGGNLQVVEGESIAGIAHRRDYKYGAINLPHDARAKTFAAKGKSVLEQFIAVFGTKLVRITPSLSFQDGIQAARKAIKHAVFDEQGCDVGLGALGQYQREWDADKLMFKDTHLHDWSSNLADGWRYVAIDWRIPPAEVDTKVTKLPQKIDKRFQLEELWDSSKKHGRQRI